MKMGLKAIGLFFLCGFLAMCVAVCSGPSTNSTPATTANPAGWVNKDNLQRESTVSVEKTKIGKYEIKAGLKSVPWQDRLQPYFVGIVRETGDKTCHETMYASGGQHYYITWCWPGHGEAVITDIQLAEAK